MNLPQKKEPLRQNEEVISNHTPVVFHQQGATYKAKKAGKNSMPHHIQSPSKQSQPNAQKATTVIPNPQKMIKQPESSMNNPLECKTLIHGPRSQLKANDQNQQSNLEPTKNKQMKTINQESEQQCEQLNQRNRIFLKHKYKFPSIQISMLQIISLNCFEVFIGQPQKSVTQELVKSQIKQFLKMSKIGQFHVRQKTIESYLTHQLIRFYKDNPYIGSNLQIFKFYLNIYVLPHLSYIKPQNSIKKQQIKLQWQQTITFLTINMYQDMNFLKDQYFIYLKNVLRMLIHYKNNRDNLKIKFLKNPEFLDFFFDKLFYCMRVNYNMMKIEKSPTSLTQILQQIVYYAILMWPQYLKIKQNLKQLFHIQKAIFSFYQNQQCDCPYFSAMFLQIFLIQPFNVYAWDKKIYKIFHNHSEALVFQLLYKLYKQNINSITPDQRFKKFSYLNTIQYMPYLQNFIDLMMNNTEQFQKSIYKIQFISKSITNILNSQTTLDRNEYPNTNKFIAFLAVNISNSKEKSRYIHNLVSLLTAWFFPKHTNCLNEKSVRQALQNKLIQPNLECIIKTMLPLFNQCLHKLQDNTISAQYFELFMSISTFLLHIQRYAPNYLLKKYKFIFLDCFASKQYYYSKLILSNFMVRDIASKQLHKNNIFAINLVTSLLKNLSTTKIALDIIEQFKQKEQKGLMVKIFLKSKEMSKAMIDHVLELFIQQFPLLKSGWYEQKISFFLSDNKQDNFFKKSGYFLNELLKRIENGSCSLNILCKIIKAPAFSDTQKILLQFLNTYNHQIFSSKVFGSNKQKEQVLNKFKISFQLIMRISHLFILHKKSEHNFANFPNNWITFMNLCYSNQQISVQKCDTQTTKILRIFIQILLGFDNIKFFIKDNQFSSIRNNILQTIVNFIKIHHIYHLNIYFLQTLRDQDFKTRFKFSLQMNPCLRSRHILITSSLINRKQRRKFIYTFFIYSFLSFPLDTIIQISEYAPIFYCEIIMVYYSGSKFKHFKIIQGLFEKIKIQRQYCSSTSGIHKDIVERQLLQNIHKFFIVIRNNDIELYKKLILVQFQYFFNTLNVQILQNQLDNKKIIIFGKHYYSSIILFLDTMKECTQSDMQNQNLKNKISTQFWVFLDNIIAFKRDDAKLDKTCNTEIFSKMVCFTIKFFEKQTFKIKILNSLMEIIGQDNGLNNCFKQLKNFDNFNVQMIINSQYGDKMHYKTIQGAFNLNIYPEQTHIAQKLLQYFNNSVYQQQPSTISKLIYLWKYVQSEQIDLSIFTKKRLLRNILEQFILRQECHLVIWVIQIIVKLVANPKIKAFSFFEQRKQLINMLYTREKYFERLTYLMKKLSWSHGNTKAFDNTYFQYLTNAKPGIISTLEKTQLIGHLNLFIVIKSLQWQPDFFQVIKFKQTTKRIIKNSEYFIWSFSKSRLSIGSLCEAKLIKKRIKFLPFANNQLQIYNYLLTCEFIEAMTLIISNLREFEWEEGDFYLVLRILKQFRKQIQLFLLIEQDDINDHQQYEERKKNKRTKISKNKLIKIQLKQQQNNNKNVKNEDKNQMMRLKQIQKKNKIQQSLKNMDRILKKERQTKDKIAFPRQKQNRFNKFGDHVYSKSQQFAKGVYFLNSSFLISRIATSFLEVKDRLVDSYFLVKQLCDYMAQKYFEVNQKQFAYYSIVMKQLQKYEQLKQK